MMKDSLITKMCDIMTFLATTCTVASAMMVNVQNGQLSFQTPEITFEGGRPGVNLLVGDEETPLQWIPQGKPQTFRTYRLTPLGDRGGDCNCLWRHPNGYRLLWTVFEFNDRPGLTLRATFTNDSDKPVKLHNFVLLHSDSQSLVCKGDAARWWLDCPNFYTRRMGNLKQLLPSERQLKDEGAYFGRAFYEPDDPRYEDGRYRAFQDGITLYQDNGLNTTSPGLMMHAVGPGVSDIRFDMGVDNGTIRMSMLSRMYKIVVDPGETRSSEECMILAEPFRDASLTMYKWIAKTHGSKLDRGPIYGWCSWYGPYNSAKERDLYAVAEAVKKYRDHMPLDVLQVDAGRDP